MKRVTFALCAVLALLITTMTARAVTFTTSGGKILKDGTPFTVKGVNVAGLNWVDNREVTQDASLIADKWKFNAIRVCNLIKVTNNPWTQYTTNNDLDRIVNTFTAKNVVVVMSLHGLIGLYANASTSPTISEVSNHFKDLAIRYKNNPYVWFDLQNEPGSQTWPENNGADWIALHQRLIKDIRDQGANNIIFVEGSGYGQEGGNWDGSTPPDGASAILSYGDQLLSFGGTSYNNIVFSLHLYEKWGYETSDPNESGFSSDAKIAGFLAKIQNKGYAFVIGEYGSFNNRTTMRATQSMFRALQNHPHVGRMVWQWTGGDSNDLTNWDQYYSWSGSGWGITPPDGTRPTNLSPLGALVWDDNHAVSGADLVVTSVGIQESSWNVGSTIHFTVTVTNQGSATTSANWLGNLWYVDGGWVDWAGYNATVGPGQSRTFVSSGWNATKTNFSLRAVTDYPNYYAETNENNNEKTVAIAR